jgi:hypothetical protein
VRDETSVPLTSKQLWYWSRPVQSPVFQVIVNEMVEPGLTVEPFDGLDATARVPEGLPLKAPLQALF